MNYNKIKMKLNLISISLIALLSDNTWLADTPGTLNVKALAIEGLLNHKKISNQEQLYQLTKIIGDKVLLLDD